MDFVRRTNGRWALRVGLSAHHDVEIQSFNFFPGHGLVEQRFTGLINGYKPIPMNPSVRSWR
jgi:hypothetical protein